MTLERRAHPRTCVDVSAQIIHRGRSISTRVRDLSYEGLLLRTDALTIPTGTLIDISLSLAGHQWQISGQIIWSCNRKMGVMFRIPQPELYEIALTSVTSAVQASRTLPLRIPSLPIG